MIFQQQLLDNYQFVTIPVLAQQNRYYFPDLPNLRHVKTSSISFYFATTLAKDINNIPLVPTSATSAFLTLTSNNEEVIQKLDLMLFNPISSNITYWNNTGVLPLDDLVFDFSKSYVEFASGVAFPAAPFSFAFGVFYKYK